MRTNQLELVGQKLRQLRRERKLTQTDLATKIGVHQSDLSRMEKGEYRVGLDTLLKILQEFDLSIGDFFEERPRAATILERYNGLSEDAKREVESFIEFKRQQDMAGWDGEESEP
jgi:transcriptional regulator with XRE-family HTH domain